MVVIQQAQTTDTYQSGGILRQSFFNGGSRWCVTAAGAALIDASQQYQYQSNVPGEPSDEGSISGLSAVYLGGGEANPPMWNLNLLIREGTGTYPPNWITCPAGPTSIYDDPQPPAYVAMIPGTIAPNEFDDGQGGWSGEVAKYGQYGNLFACPACDPPIRRVPPFQPTCAKNYLINMARDYPIVVESTLADSPGGGSLRIVRRDFGPGFTSTRAYFSSWRRVPLTCPGGPEGGDRDPDRAPVPDTPDSGIRVPGLPPGIDPATLQPVAHRCTGCGE